MRKMVMGSLKPEALQNYVGIIDSIAKKHLENWDSEKEVAVFHLTKEYAFAAACGAFLSITDPEHIARLFKPFHCILPAMLYPIPINIPGTPLNRGLKASKYLRKEILEIVRQRKKDLLLMEKKSTSWTKYDVLSHMLVTTDEEGKFMNEMGIAEKLVGFLVGGFDTSSIVIICMMNYLAELPHIYDKVLKEQIGFSAAKRNKGPLNWEDIQKMKYSWNVASEVLRLAPPAPGMFREAITDFTYAGFSIPKGWKNCCKRVKLSWTCGTSFRATHGRDEQNLQLTKLIELDGIVTPEGWYPLAPLSAGRIGFAGRKGPAGGDGPVGGNDPWARTRWGDDLTGGKEPAGGVEPADL
ncbi:hypothetical protein Vadar_010613 [Vaccinium darrowii]|uniref:Uncharacterized protein n=1 Tax=Vaccinium darrowii TaxID=229202 RepID=A0ACB7X908_9ERIC|nr:hypothetical protein Vadar_010613 [Vaccinium darrowii]